MFNVYSDYTELLPCGKREPNSCCFTSHTVCVVCLNSFPESPENMTDYPLFISIGDWLDSIKMSQYKNNFITAGYTTLDSISTMSIE